MKISGEYLIPATREKVWEALRDPDVLAKTIPGALEVKQTSPQEYEAIVQMKIGPISAKFNGQVAMSDERKPESFTLSGQGKGGAAGFAKGAAHIKLAEENQMTKLTYEAEASVGGKLAQIGQRLIDATANKMAAQFFGAFETYMTTGEVQEKAGSNRLLWWVAIGAGIIALALALALL